MLLKNSRFDNIYFCVMKNYLKEQIINKNIFLFTSDCRCVLVSVQTVQSVQSIQSVQSAQSHF